MLKSNPLCGLAGVGSVLCVRGFQPFGLQPPLYLQCKNQIVLKGTFDLSIKTEVVCSFVVLRRPTSPSDKLINPPGFEPMDRERIRWVYN